jgi:hypothetical protein
VEPVVVEFAYQAPEEVCAPAAVLEDLPQTGSQRYALDTSLSTDDRWIRSYCTYQPPELLHGDRDMLLEDHVLVGATITVFQERSDSSWASVYPDLPVGSEDLDDWAVAILYWRDLDDWRQGCEPDLVCAEGEESTVSTDAWQTVFNGFVGNLEFYVRVTYAAERLPTNAQALNVAVFRELVLAEVDRRAKREAE